MADMLAHEVFTRFELNADPTLRTSVPAYGGSELWVPVFEDGVDLAPSVESEDVATEHRDPGVRYSVFTGRNKNGGQIITPLYPENIGFLFDLPLVMAAAGIPKYFGCQQYWDTTLTGGDTGREFLGLLANGFTLNFDRENPGVLQWTMDTLINAETGVTSGPPASVTWPGQKPYRTEGVYIDFDATGLGAWSGDNPDIQTLELTFSNAMTVGTHRPNLTVGQEHYNMTWTKAHRGTPTLGLRFTIVVTDSAHLAFLRSRELESISMRIALVGSSPSGNTTSTDADVTAGSGTGSAIDVVSTSGFAAGDQVFLLQPNAGKFNVALIDSVASPTLELDDVKVSMDGGAEAITVTNTAAELLIESAEVKVVSKPRKNGNVRVVDIEATAVLAAGNTTIVLHRAYNDDAA